MLRCVGRPGPLDQRRYVDDCDLVRAACGDIRELFVRRDRDAIGQREIPFEFIKRRLKRAARIVPKYGNRITECPPVLHVREWDQVLGTHYGCDSQPPILRDSDVKYAGDILERSTIRYDLIARVDVGYFGNGLRPERSQIGVDVRSEDVGAVR